MNSFSKKISISFVLFYMMSIGIYTQVSHSHFGIALYSYVIFWCLSWLILGLMIYSNRKNKLKLYDKIILFLCTPIPTLMVFYIAVFIDECS